MPLSPIPSSLPPPGGAGRPEARSPEEAARQFERVLVRQFVEVMTKDLFQGGEDGMMTGQADLQRDTLTDTLADHLVDGGTFGIADLLLRQWAEHGRVPVSPEPAPPATPGASPDGAPPARPARAGRGGPLSMDDALRLYPPAKARPLSLDPPPRPSPDTQP